MHFSFGLLDAQDVKHLDIKDFKQSILSRNMKIDLEKIKKEKSLKELLEFSIINLDKPTGPTSFSVSHFVKKVLDLRKTYQGAIGIFNNKH